jgi:hypothetical protein
MHIAHKDFSTSETAGFDTVERVANGWLKETLAKDINVETLYKDGYFSKEGGIRIWYRVDADQAAG